MQRKVGKEEKCGHKNTAIQFKCLPRHWFSGFVDSDCKNKLPGNLTNPKMSDILFVLTLLKAFFFETPHLELPEDLAT